MVSARRKARAIALQALYEIESARHGAEPVLAYLLEESGLTEENAAFSRELVAGVLQNKDKIDEQIKRYAPAWPVAQLALIDRNILRLAIFEILLDNKVSVKVAINEAVELAKTFGSASSARFVNGVLGAISTLVDR